MATNKDIDKTNISRTKNHKTIINTAENLVVYLTFELFEKAGVKHAFSTKKGGVSTGIYKSMNLSFHRGDEYENVLENHKLFAEAVGYDYKKTVFSDQIHETQIARVSEKDMGKGMKGEKGITGMDGLVTDIPGIPLMTFYADCVPLLFYDPVKKVIGAAHAGWRGTVAGMAKCMVKYLAENMGCNVSDVLVVIGPSICMDCYEVDGDVAKKFYDAFEEKDHNKILLPKNDDKYQLNLWEANKIYLEEAGILKENIQMPDICTCHNPDLMISHRYTNGKRGNMAAVIVL